MITAMRWLVGVMFCAVILSWLLMPAPSLGQDKDRRAKAGDWVQYEEIVEDTRSGLKGRLTVKITVKAVDKETGMVKSTTTEINSKGEKEFLRSSRATLQQVLNADPKEAPRGWAKAEEVKESEESIKVNGKTYTCQRIDSKGVLPEMGGEWTRTVWTTRDASFLGWVKSEASYRTTDFRNLPTHMSRQVLANSTHKK